MSTGPPLSISRIHGPTRLVALVDAGTILASNPGSLSGGGGGGGERA